MNKPQTREGARKWLENHIRKINNLPDDFIITEEWRRKQLDEMDKSVTEALMDNIYSNEMKGKIFISNIEFEENYRESIRKDITED